MIMPANYSVIAENELSYVDGGWVDPMTSTKILETNIAKAIGKAYAQDVMSAFIGTWFTNDKDASIFKTFGDNVSGLFTAGVKDQGTGFGKVLKGIRNTIGVLGGIWVLGMNDMVDVGEVTLNTPAKTPAYTVVSTEGGAVIWSGNPPKA